MIPESQTMVKRGFRVSNEAIYSSPANFTPGTTTQLEMPAAADNDKKSNVRVTFHGLEQRSTEWEISGTTIIFNSAIPTGVTQIDIKVLTLT